MRKTKEQKGITLIALIITIIVLLILAVIAIGAVQNDGIIEHAKNARDEYGKAQVNENATLQNYLGKLNENTGKGINDGDGTTRAYVVGDIVAIGEEQFYVIKDSPETEDTVVLLAYGTIDTTNNVQTASATKVDNYDAAVTAANSYGETLDGTGRLLTYDEANALVATKKYNPMILVPNEKFTYGYWLGRTEQSESDYCVELWEMYSPGRLRHHCGEFLRDKWILSNDTSCCCGFEK